MSEAYEIGVTLALGDGVSVGIAQARRDTAQLERVLQAGGVSVQQLRAASVAALSAIRAVPTVATVAAKQPVVAQATASAPAVARVEAGQGAAPVLPQFGVPPRVTEPSIASPQRTLAAAEPPVPERVAAPVPTPGDVPTVAPRRLMAEQGPPNSTHAAAPRPSLAEPALPSGAPVVAPRPSTAEQALPSGAPSVALSPMAPTVARPSLAQETLPSGPPTMAPPATLADQAVQAPQAAPAVSAQTVWQVSAPISLATIGAAAKYERPAPAPVSLGAGLPQLATISSAEAPSVASPQMRAPDPGELAGAAPRAWGQVAGSTWTSPGGGDGAGATMRMSAGPLPSAAAPARAPEGSQGNTEAGVTAPAPAAPPPAAANAGPTEGDVFLDGALVGRWMSRFLTQQAGRASAGPTGFDPRRGRLLPGATVGG